MSLQQSSALYLPIFACHVKNKTQTPYGDPWNFAWFSPWLPCSHLLLHQPSFCSLCSSQIRLCYSVSMHSSVLLKFGLALSVAWGKLLSGNLIALSLFSFSLWLPYFILSLTNMLLTQEGPWPPYIHNILSLLLQASLSLSFFFS